MIVKLDDVLSSVESFLTVGQGHDRWFIDLEDVVRSAVFQLNARERPIMVDDLMNLYMQDDHVDDTLSVFLTGAISQVYNRLSPAVPGNMDVQEYDFLGDDIMIGGKLF